MSLPLRLLKIVGKVALNAVGGGIAGDLALDLLPEIAQHVWVWWTDDAGDRVKEVESLTAASVEQIKAAVAEVVKEVVPASPQPPRKCLPPTSVSSRSACGGRSGVRPIQWAYQSR